MGVKSELRRMRQSAGWDERRVSQVRRAAPHLALMVKTYVG